MTEVKITGDEYIELYNPSNVAFDLSGFKLVVGLTTQRFYTLPVVTILEPNAFWAFYVADTKLSISNIVSQVSLLDPFDELPSTTDVYKSVKDGEA